MHSKVDSAITRALAAQSAQGVADPRVLVIIEHTRRPKATEGVGDPAPRLAAFEREVLVLQQGLLDHLEQLGVRATAKLLTLANAIVVPLAEDEVRSVAEHPDVRQLLLAEAQHVVT